jgi:hypothetical protein
MTKVEEFYNFSQKQHEDLLIHLGVNYYSHKLPRKMRN